MDVMSFEDPRFFGAYGHRIPTVGQTMVERPTDIHGFSHPSARRAALRRSVGRTRVNTAVAGASAAGCCPPCSNVPNAPCSMLAYDSQGQMIDRTSMLRMMQYQAQWPNSLSYTGYPARWW